MNGPSEHLSWAELACHDGASYPEKWRHDRAPVLAATFEDIRALLGGVPIRVVSGYRTTSWNLKVGGVPGSQHVQGRALDLQHPQLTPRDFHDAILRLYRAGQLPLLGGLGSYPTFVHIDVRPRLGNRLARWSGAGAE